MPFPVLATLSRNSSANIFRTSWSLRIHSWFVGRDVSSISYPTCSISSSRSSVPPLPSSCFDYVRLSRSTPIYKLCTAGQGVSLGVCRGGIITCDGSQKPMWKPLVCSEELPKYIENCVLSSCGLYLRENVLTLGMWLCMAPLQATSRISCVLGRFASRSLVDTIILGCARVPRRVGDS